MLGRRESAPKLGEHYLKSESDPNEILIAMDQCRGYLDWNFKSLFAHALSLKLSRGVALNLITVARKSCEVPKLHALIRDGKMTLSNVRTVCAVLTPENQARWLQNAMFLSKQEFLKSCARDSNALERLNLRSKRNSLASKKR